jgi:hypothetical protein
MSRDKRLQKIADANLGEQSEAAKRVLIKRASRMKGWKGFVWKLRVLFKS